MIQNKMVNIQSVRLPYDVALFIWLGSLILFGSLGLPLARGAGDPDLEPAAFSGAYLGRITGERVRLRTGGSQNHYPFAAIAKDQQVVVVEDRGEWCKVLIPKWLTLYVHKDFLEAHNESATVMANRLKVRVTPEKNHEEVGILTKGSKVEIHGTSGEWVKIAPPPSAYGWIKRNYIHRERPLTGVEAFKVWGSLTGFPAQELPPQDFAAARQAPRTTSAKAGSFGSAKAGRAEKAAFSLQSPVSPRMRQALQSLSQILEEQPDGKGDFSKLKNFFLEMAQQSEDLSEVEQAEESLKFIKIMEERGETLKDIKEALERDQETDQAFQQKLREIRNLKIRYDDDGNDRGNSDPYLARGWVTGMGRFIGRQGTHRLMKGEQVLYYLKSEDGQEINLDEYIGKRIGVKGVIKELDPKYGADLVLVSEVVVLSDR